MLHDLVVLAEPGDDGGLEEVAAVALTGGRRAATFACAGSAVDEARDPVELVRVVERAESTPPRVGPPVWRRPSRGVGERGDELVVDAACAITRVAAVQSWPALK